MPKILLALSVVFMLASGVLGYMNKTKLDEARVAQAKEESDKKLALSDAATSKKSLAETTAKLTAETAKVSEMEQTIAAKEADVAKATSEVTNLNAQMTEKTALLDAANAELERLKTATPVVGTTPEVVPVDNTAQIAELTAQIEALKAEKALIGDKLVAAESKASESQQKLDNIKKAAMAQGLEGQILAVNQAWGFVVLNLGNNSGVVNNAEMVVMRDGTRIGTVKITSVEPSNSIADIQTSSLANGQRVLPGDRVIFAGN